MNKRLSTNELFEGIISGERNILSKAITLIESQLAEDQERSRELLEKIMPLTGKSLRIAVTGIPGAGKSTFLEALGKHLTSQNIKVAVLTVDPSSLSSKGSILGDKTRMEELSRDPLAFIRPSPTGNSLSGITRRTRETTLLCEAAGYEVILVETVGVGQVETQVYEMVDLFLLILITGAGDELQIMKKGIIELADIILINKADGENLQHARRLKKEVEMMVEVLPEKMQGFKPPVMTVSSLEKNGIAETWNALLKVSSDFKSKGYFVNNRMNQNIQWMKQALLELLQEEFYHSENVKKNYPQIEKEVLHGKIPPIHAALKLLKIFREER
ncbi:MAG: methylmalonyl Co-A mutase-associated GTPase MeaB [Cytophagaceae bacterium]|nr:methylmalonyl Co-A mutase-associated GTPase MeaB [Cytophagaceae bacterium]